MRWYFVFLLNLWLFSDIEFLAQKSCSNLLHWKSKGTDEVNNIRVLNNNHLLIAGVFKDSLYINNNLNAYTGYTSASIVELDNNRNSLFNRSFLLVSSGVNDYVKCVDALKDNEGNYYGLINWHGTLKLDDSTTINAYDAMIVVKINATGNVLWYYYLNNTTATSMCFDNYNNISLIAYSRAYMGYTPANILLINLNKISGQLRKYKIGINYYYTIYTNKIIFTGNGYLFACNFTDSIAFNSQKIIGNKPSAAIVMTDTNFNISKYSVLTCKSASVQINDFTIDNQQNVYLTGMYKSTNLYINDTIRLTRTSFIVEQMYVVKLNNQLQFVWAKQENQNPYNNTTNNVRNGYKLILNNNNVCVLGYFYNSLILGNDTLLASGMALILLQYNNNGQYMVSEKIAGTSISGIYTLSYNPFNQKIILSVPFSSTVSVCQSTLTSIGSSDVYIVELDKITNVSFSRVSSEESIILYPQPSDNVLHIKNYLSCDYFKIYDVYGNIIQQGSIGSNNNIDVSGLKSGVYVLCLHSLANEFTIKTIVIQKQ